MLSVRNIRSPLGHDREKKSTRLESPALTFGVTVQCSGNKDGSGFPQTTLARKFQRKRGTREIGQPSSSRLFESNVFEGVSQMKTRAAVAFEAKKPLEIVELDLEG